MKVARTISFVIVNALFLTVGVSFALPKTVEEAVAQLKSELTPAYRDYILRTPLEHVEAQLHFSLGLHIRNDFGLWGRNSQLMKSCGVKHPDDCSGVIIGRLWDAVRADADPDLVRRLDCQFQLIESVHINYAKFDQFTTGQLLNTLQDQIDAQISSMRINGTPVCQDSLKLRISGDPKPDCFVRAEFAREESVPKNSKPEVSLDRLFGWIGWRNAFDVLNEPPEISLKFRKTCTWPTRPRL